VGVLVLLLLIIGIGSALKAPSSSSNEQAASGEKSIDLSGSNATDQASATTPATGRADCWQYPAGCSLPPISSPDSRSAPAATEGQQRVEVQGDLNNALTQPASQSS
jgi:DamX protein